MSLEELLKPWPIRHGGEIIAWRFPDGRIIRAIAGAHATFTPAVQAFRWYLDGTESGSTPAQTQGTNDSATGVLADVQRHLRYRIQETGGASGATTDDYQLQVSINGGAYTNVGAGTTYVQADTSSSLTDGSATTNRATNGITDGTGSFVASQQEEGNGEITNFQLTASNFTEALWAVRFVYADLVSLGAGPHTFDFRVSLNGGSPGITNSVTPRETLTLTIVVPDIPHPRYPDRINPRRRAADLLRIALGGKTETVGGETIEADKWTGSYPARIAPRRRATALGQGVLDPEPLPNPVETIEADKWEPEAPDRIAGRRPTPATSGLIDPFPTPETRADKWEPDFPDAIAPRRRTVDLGRQSWTPETAPEAPQLDKYEPQLEDRVPRRPVPVHTTGVIQHTPVAPETVTADKWEGEAPDRIAPRPRAADLYRLRLVAGIDPEVTTADRYAPRYPDRIAARPRRPEGPSVTDPRVVAAAETITADKWEPDYPERVAQRRRATDLGRQAILVNTAAEAPQLDKYEPQFEDRVQRRRPTPATTGLLDPFPRPAGETVTADKWDGDYPDRLAPRPRALELYRVRLVAGIDPEATTADRWAGAAPAFVPARRRSPATTGIVGRDDTAPESITADKWTGEAPARIPRRRPVALGLAALNLQGDAPVAPEWYAPVAPARVHARPDRRRHLGGFILDPYPIPDAGGGTVPDGSQTLYGTTAERARLYGAAVESATLHGRHVLSERAQLFGTTAESATLHGTGAERARLAGEG